MQFFDPELSIHYTTLWGYGVD